MWHGTLMQCDIRIGSVQHYLLPMDEVVDTTIINPSGLDSKVMGNGRLVGGVQGSALRLNGRDSYVQVAGPGHRQECFGDLDKCPMGEITAVSCLQHFIR